jgi:hypothetical protein
MKLFNTSIYYQMQSQHQQCPNKAPKLQSKSHNHSIPDSLGLQIVNAASKLLAQATSPIACKQITLELQKAEH